MRRETLRKAVRLREVKASRLREVKEEPMTKAPERKGGVVTLDQLFGGSHPSVRAFELALDDFTRKLLAGSIELGPADLPKSEVALRRLGWFLERLAIALDLEDLHNLADRAYRWLKKREERFDPIPFIPVAWDLPYVPLPDPKWRVFGGPSFSELRARYGRYAVLSQHDLRTGRP